MPVSNLLPEYEIIRDPERCIREMPVVTPDGVQYGHRAWAAILATGPAPARAVGTLMRHRPIEPLARRVYTWVSGNRHRLPDRVQGRIAGGDYVRSFLDYFDRRLYSTCEESDHIPREAGLSMHGPSDDDSDHQRHVP